MPSHQRRYANLVRILLVVTAAGGLFSLALPAHARGTTVNYRRTHSYGFHDEQTNMYYFIVEYRVSKPRRPIWFIMPIERPSHVYFHKIFLYTYDATHGRLQQRAVLRDDVGYGTNIKSSRFVRRDAGIVFSYSRGYIIDKGFLHDVFVVDPCSVEVRPAGSERAVLDTSPLFQQNFGDYQSPFTANPGIVGITELRTTVLAKVSEEDWGLPREW
ncbi:MAG: hypothetical protein LC641_03175 [Spirochaeta sp.]|nr:hypothetical protein [Spirochaeta sp.]